MGGENEREPCRNILENKIFKLFFHNSVEILNNHAFPRKEGMVVFST